MNQIPTHWTWKKLGDIADFIGGVSYTPDDIATEGVRILRGGNIQNGVIIQKADDVFLPMSYSNNENQVRKYDTVIVSSTGSVEALAKAATCFENMPNTQIGAFLRIIRPEQEKYAMLVSAWCTSKHFRNYLISQAKGTSINNIRTDFLSNFTIPVPQDKDVEEISNLYFSIEKKLLLNRQINQNLEALARQLYDYWFVQFDFPDENGKPYKSSGGTMVWNEKLKREIPDGWTSGVLSDMANITMGQSPDGKSYNNEGNGIIFYQGSTDFGERFPKVRQFTTEPTRFAKKGDILMSVRAPVGALNIANNDCCVGRGLASINSKLGSINHLFYVMLSFKEMFDRKSDVGTTFGSITKDELYGLPVLMPNEGVLKMYEKECGAIFKRQMILGEEIDSLIKQRNELLPLLMNGQVNFDLSAC